jgi:hypothetical protein
MGEGLKGVLKKIEMDEGLVPIFRFNVIVVESIHMEFG